MSLNVAISHCIFKCLFEISEQQIIVVVYIFNIIYIYIIYLRVPGTLCGKGFDSLLVRKGDLLTHEEAYLLSEGVSVDAK